MLPFSLGAWVSSAACRRGGSAVTAARVAAPWVILHRAERRERFRFMRICYKAADADASESFAMAARGHSCPQQCGMVWGHWRCGALVCSAIAADKNVRAPTSDFGFRPSFGLRLSGFGFPLPRSYPLKSSRDSNRRRIRPWALVKASRPNRFRSSHCPLPAGILAPPSVTTRYASSVIR